MKRMRWSVSPARVQRGPSQAARCASKETGHCTPPLLSPLKDWEAPEGMEGLASTARIERALSHRARSASKKDGLATPYSPFCDRALREQRGRPHHPLIRRPSSILPDTPLQSSPNPSETDPCPSTPSSSDPRSGRCPAKSHRPGSAGRCAAQTPT